MRFCGGFHRFQNVAGPENRNEADALVAEGLGSALLAIDDADGRADDETGRTKRLHRLHERAARRDHVLDEADEIALFVRAFEPVRRAVLLRRLPHDHEREAARERARRRQRDGAELRACEADRVGLELLDRGGDAVAERTEDVRARLEAVLVEVVARAPPRPEHEVALEIRRFSERELQLVVGQAVRVWPMIWRASGSSRSAPGEPFERDSIEPSSKYRSARSACAVRRRMNAAPRNRPMSTPKRSAPLRRIRLLPRTRRRRLLRRRLLRRRLRVLGVRLRLRPRPRLRLGTAKR